jgi:hypothetical protein
MATDARITLRLPADVYVAAKAAAESANISLNEQIVIALSNYLNVKDTLAARIEQLENAVADLQQRSADSA